MYTLNITGSQSDSELKLHLKSDPDPNPEQKTIISDKKKLSQKA